MTGGGGTASCSCWFCQGSTLKVASDGQQWLEELLEVLPEPLEVPLELSEPQEVLEELLQLLLTVSRREKTIP